MSRIRSKNTEVEKLVFRALRKDGFYFRKHYSRVLGCPDIALPRKKKAVFIDGDFWHGYQFARLKKRLPANYWIPKIESNIKRDRRNRESLRRAGWRLLRIWEHEIKEDFDAAVDKISEFLRES